MDSFFSLDIGKAYDTSFPRATGKALYSVPVPGEEDHYIGSLKPDEYFILLEKDANNALLPTKILTSGGQVGWTTWDRGRRFVQLT